MAGDGPFDTPWEDDEDGGVGEDSVIDAFDAYLPPQHADEDADDLWDAPEPKQRDEQDLTYLFTATNPAGTVSATALVDGSVVRVELAPTVTKLTEPELAKEITTTSMLARQQARAGLYAVIAHFGRQLGHDEGALRNLLEHELHLPSPGTVYEEQARIFAAHYNQDHDRPAN